MKNPVHPVTGGGTFGMMAGDNPMHPAAVPATHENLIRTLKQMGLHHEETQGIYGAPERSVIIHNPRLDQMKTLGKLFGQDSVIHSTGGKHELHYTNGPHEGKKIGTNPAQNPHEWFENPPEGNYTHLPGNGYFRINFDNGPDAPVAKSSPIFKYNSLKKGLPAGAKLDVKNPGDQTENKANRAGFPGSKEHMVMEDAGGGPQPVGITSGLGSASPLLENNLTPSANRRANAIQDVSHANQVQNGPPGPQEPAEAFEPEWKDSFLDGIKDKQFWGQPMDSVEYHAHPNYYEWHDGHTDHHSPRPWDKQTAMATARTMGLIKHGEPKPELPKNDQAAGVGAKDYARFAAPFGSVTPGKPSDLMHYDYKNKLADVSKLVAAHGFKTHYAGGKYGKPDLANKNYNTGHLMIYDPTPQSGGDFNDKDYTDSWRQMHELSHALTYPQINNVYGEGRRIGKLGTHRTMNEAMRAVHWEWLAAHKQRELSKNIGVHVSDETFHKELNTIMHDAVHRAVTGQFTEPAQEGFQPASHKVPLETSLDMVRDAGKKMGLNGLHETIAKKSEPRIVYVKAKK